MDVRIELDPEAHRLSLAVSERGRALLANPFTNKGTAFTPEERDALALNGLLPPAVSTVEQQLARVYESFQAKATDLEKFIYLTALQDRNETLFFRLVHEHIDEMMPIVYTPVVGEACQRFSHIYRRGRGLYVSYDQRHRIETLLASYPVASPPVIVATDGERILGLGDQGTGGMGIPIGKLCLYTLCAGIPPYNAMPVMLDVGTDNEERLADPLYLGLRHRRVRGAEYQAFIDRFVAAVQKVHPDALLQWEDLLKGNAIAQLHRFRDRLCSFNDDIQGTAGVVVAGIYSALRITGRPLREQRVLFAGAGASAQGISNLIVSALIEDGLMRDEARRRIWTTDSRGLVTTGRADLEGFKATYARDVEEVAAYACADRSRITLEEAIANARPTILIGTCKTPGAFSERVIARMAEINPRPIVFPLSNPTSKSECTPADAIRWSGGRAIVATGSPFAPVTYEGTRYRVGQGNNAFVFPGIGLGVSVARAARVTDGMFLDAAKALAAKVTARDLGDGAVYPELIRMRECSHAVACAVVRRAVAEGHARVPAPADVEAAVGRAMWFPDYVPIRYESARGVPALGATHEP